ncbi:VOC family protein [Arthrobacter rhombi]|uniref:VOC family protein n=1 Tax=Arthrobacter rhombi TaxID=71253 RepID=UPI003FD5F85A
MFVDDQAKAERFSTEVLGFVKKNDLAVGTEGAELRLEPSGHPAAKPFKEALVADGIPFTQFAVADVQDEYERLRSLGLGFTQEPITMGPVTTSVFDDTSGNLIQIATLPD